MKILVLGSGAREHALAWKLKQSPQCAQVFLHPGNAGTRREGFQWLGELVVDAHVIARKAKAQGIELVVIGPEIILAQGFAESLRGHGFLVVGPTSAGALLETSKVFAKEFMKRADVPTPDFSVIESEERLSDFVPTQWPVVLKLDGLAAGKGVVIAETVEQMHEFGERVWKKHEFGKGPQKVLLEGFVPGHELSYIGLCDGKTFLPLSSATDYKRAQDGDQGPNTGGMGAISPSPYFSPDLERKIDERIVQPILRRFEKDELDYRGVLYIGLMITKEGDPYVLEFNARFGDPETQALMLRLDSDLTPLLLATAKGELKTCELPKWKEETAVYVVLAAQGYPAKVKTGDFISGLDQTSPETKIFFSGVEQAGSHLVSQGGRVLGIGGLGANAETARENVYKSLVKIHWNGMHYRRDIGHVPSKAEE